MPSQTLPSTDIKQADVVSSDLMEQVRVDANQTAFPGNTYARITCSHQNHLIHMHTPLSSCIYTMQTRASNVVQHPEQ